MTQARSRVTSWCAGFLGVALLGGCSADTDAGESVDESADELRRGSRQGARRGHHGHHDRGRHGHRHRHGPRCGHGDHGTPGAAASAGTSSAGGGGMGSGGTGGTGATATGGTATGGMATGGFAGGFAGSGGPGEGVCGDGVPWWPEECDDGGTEPGDGCNESCQVEPGYTCDYGGACRVVVCGDGQQDSFALGGGAFDFEHCDDGNTASGDGCDESCALEVGFVCEYPGTPCREVVCGDGFQDAYFVPGAGGSGGGATGGTGGGFTGGSAGVGGSAGSGAYVFEGCDDGNVASGDGCDASCSMESGWVCWYPGMPCRPIVCGDGFADWPDEECDDGNQISGDGCSDCTLDEGTGGIGGSGMGGFGGTSGTGGFAGLPAGGVFSMGGSG